MTPPITRMQIRLVSQPGPFAADTLWRGTSSEGVKRKMQLPLSAERSLLKGETK